MKIFAILLSGLIGSVSFAGGITCKHCPAESNACAPKPGCAAVASKTYRCQFEGTNNKFYIHENNPYEGFATISPAPRAKPLKFTQSSETHQTGYGVVTVTKKIYFHPLYEFQLFLTTGADYHPPDIENLKGRYISEMNSDQTFRCFEGN